MPSIASEMNKSLQAFVDRHKINVSFELTNVIDERIYGDIILSEEIDDAQKELIKVTDIFQGLLNKDREKLSDAELTDLICADVICGMVLEPADELTRLGTVELRNSLAKEAKKRKLDVFGMGTMADRLST